MRLICWLKILLLVFFSAAKAVAQERGVSKFHYREWIGSPVDWRVEMSLETNQFKAGNKVPLMLIIRNITVSERMLVATYAFQEYWIEIKTADGKAVPYTHLATSLHGPAKAYSVRPVSIAANGMWKSSIDLAQYFQITEPGAYAISTRRHYSWSAMDSDGKVIPKENPSDPKSVSFTIVP